MALIDLKTNLKSLKYGRDTVDGGDSKQPLVKTPIPESFAEIGNTGGFDSMFRGGVLLSQALINDEFRIGKLINTLRVPQGAAFKTKLNLLSKFNVRTQASTGDSNQGIYRTTNTLVQIGLNPFDGRVDLFDAETDGSIRYLDSLKKSGATTNSNRLYYLYDSKIVNNQNPFLSIIAKQQGFNLLNSNQNALFEYKGGPGSGKGANGSTIIKLSNPTDKGSVPYLMTAAAIADRDLYFNQPTSTIESYVNNVSVRRNDPSKDFIRPLLGDPGNRRINRNLGSNKSYFEKSAGTNLLNYKPLYRSTVPEGKRGDILEEQDFVDFFIGTYSNNPNDSMKAYMTFPVFVDGVSDNYTAEWQNHQMLGRGEKFYTYNGFTRQFSFNLTVHAQTRGELLRQYQKINYLISTLTPDYSGGSGIMKGNFAELTIGDYLREMPGIITSLNLTVPDNSPWNTKQDTWTYSTGQDGALREFSEGNRSNAQEPQLPHMVKLAITFIPIHKFTPSRVWLPYVKYNEDPTPYRDADTGQLPPESDVITSRYISLPEGGYQPEYERIEEADGVGVVEDTAQIAENDKANLQSRKLTPTTFSNLTPTPTLQLTPPTRINTPRNLKSKGLTNTFNVENLRPPELNVINLKQTETEENQPSSRAFTLDLTEQPSIYSRYRS